MTAPKRGTADAYFDEMWGTGPDPWDHGGRFYEHRKYALTAAALGSPRYGAIFEPGCATGILTALLAPRADRYVASDRHPRAVQVTTERVAHHRHVDVGLGIIPADWPDGVFDVVVLSEVLYYLDPAGVRATLDHAADSAAPDGELVAVHFRELVPEHALPGDDVHAIIEAHTGWSREVRHLESSFVLEVYRRR